MDARTAMMKVSNSPIAVSLRNRRKRKAFNISSESSSNYGQAPIKPKKQVTTSQFIEIDEHMDPYSGMYNVNKVLNTKSIGSSSSKESSSSSTNSFLTKSHKKTPANQSYWPQYELITDEYTDSSSYTEYETYSCSSLDCSKKRIHRPDATNHGPTIVPCPRVEQTKARQKLPPLEERGVVKNLKYNKPYAHRLGHVPVYEHPIDPELSRQLDDHKDTKPRRWNSHSEYTYSYSSCSDSACSQRQCYKIQRVSPATKKSIMRQPTSSSSSSWSHKNSTPKRSISVSSSSSPKIEQDAPHSLSSEDHAKPSKPPSSRSSVIQSKSSNKRKSSSSRSSKVHRSTSLSSQRYRNLETKATGSNVVATTNQYDQNLRN